jgi:DNA mismatch endonuclease (patch repair protein)
MIDKVTKDTRSRMMAAIRSTNTTPEILLRKALFSRGFRYRLHQKNLPGSPDIVFASRRAVILVDGCFWHGHTCGYARLPLSNVKYWSAKISRNVQRDSDNIKFLSQQGWRICRVWECSIRYGKSVDELIEKVGAWLIDGRGDIEFARIKNKKAELETLVFDANSSVSYACVDGLFLFRK